MKYPKRNIQNGIAFLLLFVMQLFSAQYKMPVAYVISHQAAQSGNEAGMCIDNNLNTLYHSKYDLTTAIPDQLNFHFSNRVKSVNQLVYKPRQSGPNGIWTKVKIKYSTQTNPAVFADATGEVIWAADNTTKTINLSTAIIKPAVIRIEVLTAENNFSSCAEMEFYSAEQMDPVVTECALPTSEFAGLADFAVIPDAAGSSASNFQSGNDIDKSLDGDLATIYHSSWSATTFPVSLIYKFDGQSAVSYLKYIPRQDGGANGNFGNIKISYNTLSNANYIQIITTDFGKTGTTKTAYFPSAITPLNIKIEVLDGEGGFASCAEMQFFRTNPNTPDISTYSAIFGDPLFSTLKTNVTQQDIDGISSPFIKGLAQCLFNNTYNKQYRVQSYTAYKKTETINTQYKLGNYNLFENPVGIAFQANTPIVVFAKDITTSNKVYLKIRDFATESGTAQLSPENTYELKNGFNLINVTNTGLGYISYYTDDANAAPVSLNIASGIVNGFYKKGTHISEWKESLTNAVYPKIDMVGYYNALVIDKSAVSSFHYEDPQPLVDKYDMIVKSERELMGFYKYNTNFKNRQNVYTESTGGWFAGNYGVHLDLTWGMQNTASASGLDIWGVAHEFGHTNQVRPGLRWKGTGEITNNIYSVWAYYNMYSPSGSNRFTRLEGEVADKTVFPQVAGNRYGEFIINTQINEKSVMDQFLMTSAHPEDKNFRSLIPFWQLQLYYQLAGASKNAATLPFDANMSDEETQAPPTPATGVDYAHWLAAVIKKSLETDESQLSNGQMVMNFVKNVCDAVQEDLTGFFTKTGFLKPIDGTIDDYGQGQLTITQSMIDDTKAYIASKGYAAPASPVINYISANSINAFKNLLPVSGTTGNGVQITTTSEGQFLLVDNSQWNNAVAFETYNATDVLLSVSIVGTGDTTLANTYVDFPANAQKVYAVGYNGQKILVHPSASVTTWNGSAWDNGVPTVGVDAIIAGDYSTASQGNITAKNITINTGNSLEVNNGFAITATGITVNNGGNFIQRDGSALTTANFTVNKNTTSAINKYVFWASPTVSQNMFGIYTVAPEYVMTYDSTTDYYTVLNNPAISTAGVGYSVKMPATNATAVFGGASAQPNNGDIPITLNNTSLNKFNLIGNPYPSNIDLNAFYTANSSSVGSTFWFWDNTSNSVTTQTGSTTTNVGYATFNAPGGTWVEAPTSLATHSGVTAAIGQGFIVKAIGATVTFTNAIRVSSNGNTFNKLNGNDTGKFWLKLATPYGSHTTQAVTYGAGASDAYDIYDSKALAMGSDAFYSTVGTEKLVIQGKSPFTDDDVVSLGSKHFEAGNFVISLIQKEGVFDSGQAIYLHDKDMGTYTDLQNQSYSFAANAGEFMNRFEIVYKLNVLSTSDIEKNAFEVYRDGEDFFVRSNKIIEKIEIFDAAGRMVRKITASSKLVQVKLDGKGLYIVKAVSAGKEYTKKIIK